MLCRWFPLYCSFCLLHVCCRGGVGQTSIYYSHIWNPVGVPVIIPNDWCHPKEHKTAAIRCLYNRMETYKLTHQNRQKERNKIKQILMNNKYDALTASRLNNNKKKQKKQEQDIQKVKWVKLIYVGNETRLIIKLFKHTILKIVFTTGDTIDRLLST